MVVWFSCVVKWLPQQIQLTSIFSPGPLQELPKKSTPFIPAPSNFIILPHSGQNNVFKMQTWSCDSTMSKPLKSPNTKRKHFFNPYTGPGTSRAETAASLRSHVLPFFARFSTTQPPLLPSNGGLFSTSGPSNSLPFCISHTPALISSSFGSQLKYHFLRCWPLSCPV